MEHSIKQIYEHQITIILRKATPDDFRKVIPQTTASGLKPTLAPKIGQPYWLKSELTGKFDNRNYQINENTDWTEFREYMKREMVFVPKSDIEINN